MKFKVKLYLFIALVLVLMCFIGYTYSRYRDEATGDIVADIKPWKILIDDEDISSGSIKTIDVTPVIIDNPSVLDGKWAPGTMGYINLMVDDSNTTLSHTIDFIINSPDNNTDINIYAVKECDSSWDNCGNMPTSAYNSFDILKTYNGNPFNPSYFKLLVEWSNNSASSVDNEKDTDVGSLETSTEIFNVTINVNQMN